MWNDPRRDSWEYEDCPDCGCVVVIKRRPHSGRCATHRAAYKRTMKAQGKARAAEREAARLAAIRPDHWVEYVESNGNTARAIFDTLPLAEAYAADMMKRGARSTWIERYAGPNRSAE